MGFRNSQDLLSNSLATFVLSQLYYRRRVS
jgi:hypothetical protein